jgi:hypothetical protein
MWMNVHPVHVRTMPLALMAETLTRATAIQDSTEKTVKNVRAD